QREQNASLINSIVGGQIVRMYGPKASGKSSRAWDAIMQLHELGYECIYVSLEGCDVSSTMFWSHFNGKIEPEAKLPKPIMDATSFEETFDRGHDRWRGRQVVLFIDEFDKLHNEGAEHNCEWMLATINSIRTQNKSAIRSIVVIGTYAILSLNQKNVFLSPFNAENFQAANLTKQQIQNLYNEFATEWDFVVDSSVVDDIFVLTEGHAGLVAICGRLIYDTLIEPGSKNVTLENWKQITLRTLDDEVLKYGTFRRMVDVLKDSRFKNALDFLRSHFLGAFDYYVQLVDPEHLRMAGFLAAQGVLQPSPTESATKFRMSSPLIDLLIRRMVIPRAYPISSLGIVHSQ
ncbi:286_t:CDS:2, partial [Paraglomus brasilianum]